METRTYKKLTKKEKEMIQSLCFLDYSTQDIAKLTGLTAKSVSVVQGNLTRYYPNRRVTSTK